MMPAETSRPGSPEVPADLRGTWVGDELTAALRDIDALTHALATLQEGMRLQQEEIARLREGLATVDGRSQRHEAGQEIARGLRQEIAALQSTLDAEGELRRDLVARVDRSDARAAETQRELQRVLTQIASRLDMTDGRQAALAEREHHLSTDLADQAREEQTAEARLTDVERRVAAEQEASRHTGQEIARVAGAIPDVLLRIEDLGVRLRALQDEQRRVIEEVAAIRAIRDREAELQELLEQHRVARARTEDRLSTLEEALESARRQQTAAQEQLALLARDRAHEAEERRLLQERLEAQRDTVTEQLRRILRAEDDRARRRIEEIERDVRIARTLLARLDEPAAGEQEQPL